MLLGQYRLTLNVDHSLVIPPAFRELFEDGLYITRGFEENLLVMSGRVFNDLSKRGLAMNITDPLVRLLRRLIFGNASSLEISDTGCVLIPQDLATFASLEKEVILVGQGDYFEVWSPAGWEKQVRNLLDIDANTERFSELDLALP